MAVGDQSYSLQEYYLTKFNVFCLLLGQKYQPLNYMIQNNVYANQNKFVIITASNQFGKTLESYDEGRGQMVKMLNQ